MPNLEDIKNKAAALADQAVDKVSQAADSVTKGKYSEQIETAQNKAHEVVGKAEATPVSEMKAKAAGAAEVAVDKVGHVADSVTKGKYSDKIGNAQGKAHDFLGKAKEDAQEDHVTPLSPVKPASPAARTTTSSTTLENDMTGSAADLDDASDTKPTKPSVKPTATDEQL